MVKKQKPAPDHDSAVVSDDPTVVSGIDMENLAREAVKKFKSMG